MPTRNKRKRATIKAEPSDSDYDSDSSVSDSEMRAPAKRPKGEVKAEVKAEESDDDFIIELSDHEMGNVSDDFRYAPRQSVRRSAGGGPPRRGVDVRRLYEEAGADSLPRSLGQVVKEEVDDSKPLVLANAKEEEGVGESPLTVSACVRRAAAVRASQLLSGDDDATSVATEEQEYGEDFTQPTSPRKTTRGKNGRYFTEEQRTVLRVQFEIDPCPHRETKEDLSHRLGVGYNRVHYWFLQERTRKGVAASGEDLARRRCRFGPVMYDKLVAQFELNPHPDAATIQNLAEEAGATVRQVSQWFTNRRRRTERKVTVKRLQLSSTQRNELEAVFQATPYPDRQTTQALAKQMKCTEQQIRNWFRSARRRVGIFRGDNARDLCAFGPDGYDKLVAQYETDPFPDRVTRTALASQLGGTFKQVSNWFMKMRNRDGVRHTNSRARQMCAFGPAIYDKLLASCDMNPYPDTHSLAALAKMVGGTQGQMGDWFRGERRRRGIRKPTEGVGRSVCLFGASAYDELAAQFGFDPYPDTATVAALAAKFGGTKQQIKRWFEHRRSKQGIRASRDERARRRCKYGPEMYDELVAQFEADPCPCRATIEELADRAGATRKQITNWFWNRRNRWKQ